jgi:phosphatidate cytidylyltransferase
VNTVLKQRVITACLLLLVLALVLFVLPFHGFLEAISLLLVVAAWEWANMAGLHKPWQRIAYAGFFALLFFVLMHMDLQRWAHAITGILFLAVLGWVFALFAVIRYPSSKQWHQPLWLSLTGFWLLLPAWLGLQLLQPAVKNSALISDCSSRYWCLFFR